MLKFFPRVMRSAAVAIILLSVSRMAVAQTFSPAPGSVAAQALLLHGLIAEWHGTADGRDFKLVKAGVDKHLRADGALDVSGSDAVALGLPLVVMYRVTLEPKYWQAAVAVHERLAADRRVPPQDRYAATTFLAAYAATAPTDFKEVMQIVSPLNSTTENKGHPLSAEDLAWPMAAMVDALDWLPETAPERTDLLKQFVASARSPKPAASRENATGSRLQNYALLKGVRRGWLPSSFETGAVKAAQLLHSEAGVDARGQDLREAAAAMLLSSEMAQSATATMARGKTVAVDAWFNSQRRRSATGGEELFHYKWEDDSNNGFSFFGRAFQGYGATLSTLARPTAQSLKDAKVYLIVSPDIPIKNPKPNYVAPEDVEAVAAWVSGGGVLVLMQNDGANAEFEHFNTLSERFGIHFNPVDVNPVEGNKFEQGRVVIPAEATGIFHQAHNAYMKDICTIATQIPARPVLRDLVRNNGDVFMAVAKYGKGTVYGVVDPWLYNEYTDGRKLGPEWDQFAAAKELARWALEQVR